LSEASGYDHEEIKKNIDEENKNKMTQDENINNKDEEINQNLPNQPIINDNTIPLYKVPKDNTKEPIADYSKLHAAGF
jgi:hypothetical protein